MGGWMLGYSLPMELDVVLYLTAPKEHYVLNQLQPHIQEFLQTVPKDWQATWVRVAGETPRSFSALNFLGSWAGTLFEGDFSRATMPMRELRLEDAIEVRRHQLRDLYHEKIAEGENSVAHLQHLEQQLMSLMIREAGIPHPGEGIAMRRVANDVERCVAFLRNGSRHSLFWMLVDRFYYETYLPWRMSQLPVMEAQAQRAALLLSGEGIEAHPPAPASEHVKINLPFLSVEVGNPSTPPSGILYSSDAAPKLTWLPQQNPLRSSPTLAERVQQGNMRIFFWVDPFGLFDSWSMEPGTCVVTFGEPGQIYENFRAFVSGVATRAQALADPTRLLIMRMIRHFSLDNTTMSNYMGISRPTVSEHARILREAGFIQTFQEGRQARHEVQREAVTQFIRDLKEYLDLDIEV